MVHQANLIGSLSQEGCAVREGLADYPRLLRCFQN